MCNRDFSVHYGYHAQKSPHSSYMFFFIISHISSKKRGKVCMRYLCPL